MGMLIENYRMNRLSTLIFYLALLELFALPFSYEVATASLILGWVLYLYKGFKYKFNWQWHKIDIPIGVFVIFGLLSILVAPDKAFSFYNFWNLVGRYLLTYYLVVQNFPERDPEVYQKILLTLLISFVIVLIYGGVQGAFGLGLKDQGIWVDNNTFANLTTRVYSTWYNPNIFGGYLDIMLGIVAGLFMTTRNGAYKITLAVIFLGGFLILAMTYARGAILAIIVALGLYTALKKRKLFLILIVLVAVALVFNPLLLERIMVTTHKLDTSSEMRLAFWTSTWAMIKDHPLLGIGWGQFYLVYPHYDYYMQGDYIKIVHAHNLYLNMWAEIGIFGFLGYIATFATGIYNGLRAKVNKYAGQKGLLLGIGLGFLAMAFNGLTDYVLFNVELSMLAWFLLAIITVITGRERW